MEEIDLNSQFDYSKSYILIHILNRLEQLLTDLDLHAEMNCFYRRSPDKLYGAKEWPCWLIEFYSEEDMVLFQLTMSSLDKEYLDKNLILLRFKK